MRKLDHPPLKAQGAFGVCAMSVQDMALRSRLFGAIDAIGVGEATYSQLGLVSQLFQFPASDHVAELIDGAEMEKLYTQTLARQDSTARPYYNALRGSAPNDICPYCGQRTVSTLDHYLPKAIYPVLAVTPINLVPACGDCNKVKLDFEPQDAEGQILHPYFDDVTSEVWLRARVSDNAGVPVVEFFSTTPTTWSTELGARLETHLRALKLPALYTSHAAEELVNNREALQRLRHAGGADAVKRHCLEEEGQRRTVHRNNWQAAYHLALAESDWFCDQGVLAIEESKPSWPDDPTAALLAQITAEVAQVAGP